MYYLTMQSKRGLSIRAKFMNDYNKETFAAVNSVSRKIKRMIKRNHVPAWIVICYGVNTCDLYN